MYQFIEYIILYKFSVEPFLLLCIFINIADKTGLTFSEAVANRVPCRLRAMQLKEASCAAMSTGAFSVLAKSIIWTWPNLRPGNANNELLLFGHITHRPGKVTKIQVEVLVLLILPGNNASKSVQTVMSNYTMPYTPFHRHKFTN